MQEQNTSSTHPPRKVKKTRTATNSYPIRQVDEESDTDLDDSMQPIRTVKQRQDGCTPPTNVHVEVDKVPISTGVNVSIMSKNKYHKLWPGRSL